MSAVDQVSGANSASSSNSSQEQSAVNGVVGTIAGETFQMMMNQLTQTASAFQETMQDDDDPSGDS